MQQSASQLSYRLVDGMINLQPLRILDSRAFTWKDWDVAIHILGASHAVVFRCGAVCVTEMLTCAHREPAQESLLALDTGEESAGSLSMGGLFCRVRITPFCLDEGDALRGRFPDERRFQMLFPGGGQSESAPITRIGWHQVAGNLMIETVHSYPEENRGVRSVSLFVQEKKDDEGTSQTADTGSTAPGAMDALPRAGAGGQDQ